MWSSTSARPCEGRATFLETIRRVAEQLNIPLTAGGGIRKMEDGRAVLRAGADKVTVNTAAVERPELISELAQQFGSQAVVLSMDVKRKGDSWEAYTRGGRDATGLDAAKWAAEAVVARRGRNFAHLDRPRRHVQRVRLRTTAKIAATVPVPVIASGGANTFEDFLAVFTEGSADAALAASIFHSETHSIAALKQFLAERGVPVRSAVELNHPMIIPCIDLQGGKAVQLVRGRRLALAVDDVLGLLERFREYPILHVIDLDAAMRKGSNGRWIKLLCDRANMKVRVGGGIRTAARAAKILSWGAEKMIIGSAAFRDGKVDREFLGSDGRASGAKARDHRARYRGRANRRARLAERLKLRPEDVIPELEPYCSEFLSTFVDNEGTMKGTDLAWFRKLRACNVACPSPPREEFAACARCALWKKSA